MPRRGRHDEQQPCLPIGNFFRKSEPSIKSTSFLALSTNKPLQPFGAIRTLLCLPGPHAAPASAPGWEPQYDITSSSPRRRRVKVGNATPSDSTSILATNPAAQSPPRPLHRPRLSGTIPNPPSPSCGVARAGVVLRRTTVRRRLLDFSVAIYYAYFSLSSRPSVSPITTY